jgi:hypothetical protein
LENDEYAIEVNASGVFEQPGNQAVYYSVIPREGLSEEAVLDDILAGQNYLYNQTDPSAYLGYDQNRTYYVVFYDRNLQAISYYKY